MHLQEIVLQGFKSYTSTVKISDLSKFTAITGLNGTGKSNIIDGIIFCLNLDTNKTLRIKRLEDLINTNCNEAIVLLKFNNCTISRSINREGKSKIYINNTLSTPKTLKKLLNQNNIQKNAQNVILQGNITKILSLTKNNYLVQETANIRVYMQEKEEALELIKKKEEKLYSTKEILKRRAEPYIEKLRSERGIYVEMKRCEEAKNKNLLIVEENEKVLNKNEQDKKLLALQGLLKEYEERVAEFNELKAVDDKITNVDYNAVYDLRGRIDILKRELKIVNVKLSIDTEKDKENVETNKKKKKDNPEVTDIGELKTIIQNLKEKEKLLVNEIRSKESAKVGLSKENVSYKLDNINELKNERRRIANKISEIKENVSELGCLDGENLDILHKKYTERIEDLEKIKVNENDINIVKSKYNKLISKIHYPIRKGVYGTVIDNFTINDNRHKEIIDIVLGARRKYVIVEDENIGTQILKNAKQRVNIIPLNKIRPRMDVKKEKVINRNGGVSLLKCIVYEPKMRKAMEYIFGNYFLFEDKGQAKKICNQEKVPCISLDGNLYDPRGIVTGGITKRYNEEHIQFSELLKTQQVLQDLEIKSNTFLGAEKEYTSMCQFLAAFDNYKKLENQRQALNEKIILLEKFLNENVDLKEEHKKVVKLLASSEKQYLLEQNRINEEKDAEFRKLENEKERLMLTAKQRELKLEIETLTEELNKLEIENERLSIYEKDKTICEDKLKFTTINMARLKKAINKLVEDLSPSIMEKEQTSDAQALPDYTKSLNDKLVYLLPFIRNKIDTLTAEEEETLRVELINAKRELETILKKRRKTMDPHNYEFLEKNEEALKFLEEKIVKLESDKNKLIQKVNDLNKESELELQNAYNHLNREAGKYLRLFLPDSDIKLDADYNIGVKINTWKNSVDELSGGQRSLVALSLIFAMLSYKPAPFYLFDEVDSALDISMTMNIGLCIKQFTEAQFVVVSLKEEFYKNASSIYQVFLSDGKTNVKKLK